MKRFHLDSTLSRYPLLILSLPFIGVTLLTRLSFQPIVDEHLFHLKAIGQIASSFPFFNLKDYSSASGPLPYIFLAMMGKIIGFDLWKLRFLTVLISYLSSVLFLRTCQDEKIPSPLLKTLILSFFPYIFLYSFTVYTMIFTLFWEIFSLRYFLKYGHSQAKGDLIWGSIGSLALVFSRQIDVALPVGILCFFLVENRLKKLASLLACLVPIGGLLLLVSYWKGTTPPPFHARFPLSFKLTQFTLFLTVLGCYLQPIGLFEGRRLRGWPAFCFLILIPYLLVFNVPYPKEGLGIIYYGIDFVSKTSYGGVSLIGPLYLGLVGGLVFYGIARGIRESPKPPLVSYVLLFYILLSGFNPLVYERYYYFAWPLVLLLLPRDVSGNRTLLMIVLLFLVGVSLSYAKVLWVFPK
jgi:hypothetical protein